MKVVLGALYAATCLRGYGRVCSWLGFSWLILIANFGAEVVDVKDISFVKAV